MSSAPPAAATGEGAGDTGGPAAAGGPPGVREALVAAARHELGEQGASGVSLRAVARRAGVSHAAPKHHFRDRAGLLSTVAADGYRRLTATLRAAGRDTRDLDGERDGDGGGDRGGVGPTEAAPVVAALGRAYLDFALDNPALFELMFRSDQLHGDDTELVAAREESLGVLLAAVHAAHPDQTVGDTAQDLALIAWAFVHGLAVLVGDGALDRLTEPAGPAAAGTLAPLSRDTLAATLTATFTRRLLDAPLAAAPDQDAT